MKRVSAMTAIAVLGMSVTAAQAQNVHISRLYEQVLENLEYANAGYVLDSFGVVRINGNERLRIALDVPSETSIQIMGDCDEDCFDLDLVVRNGAGKTLGEDLADDYYPIVDFVSGADGRIEIELNMVDCDASYCYAAYSVFVDDD